MGFNLKFIAIRLGYELNLLIALAFLMEFGEKVNNARQDIP